MRVAQSSPLGSPKSTQSEWVGLFSHPMIKEVAAISIIVAKIFPIAANTIFSLSIITHPNSCRAQLLGGGDSQNAIVRLCLVYRVYKKEARESATLLIPRIEAFALPLVTE